MTDGANGDEPPEGRAAKRTTQTVASPRHRARPPDHPATVPLDNRAQPPTLLVLFIARRRADERSGSAQRAVAAPPLPRLAVVRDGVIELIKLETERAARLLGALALPAWALTDDQRPTDDGALRGTDDVLRLMSSSLATESRARTHDLGPTLARAGLEPSDYLDVDLSGKRDACRELRNACTDISLLRDATDLETVRWVLDTAAIEGSGDVDVAMDWLLTPDARAGVLTRFRELERHARDRASASGDGWRVAVSRTGAVPAGHGGETSADYVRPRVGPARSRKRRLGLVTFLAAVTLGALTIAVVGQSERQPARPPGVIIDVDNRTTSGEEMREDQRPLQLTTRPVTGCITRGCIVKDSPRWESGQRVDRAVCQQRGERITNGNDTTTADDHNPRLVVTHRYYGVALAGGQRGYVAEIWVARAHRGGLRLPPCSTVLPELSRR